MTTFEILAFDGCDELDTMNPYGVLAALGQVSEDTDVALVALDPARLITASHGALLQPHRAASEYPDVLIVPGGGWNDQAPDGAWAQAQRGELPAYIAAAHGAGAVTCSVCTGAMILAAAGLVEGRRATTHHGALDDLRAAGAEVIPARVVDDGDLVTAGGVTSGLDLALHLIERFFTAEVAWMAERELEYERRGTVIRSATSRPEVREEALAG